MLQWADEVESHEQFTFQISWNVSVSMQSPDMIYLILDTGTFIKPQETLSSHWNRCFVTFYWTFTGFLCGAHLDLLRTQRDIPRELSASPFLLPSFSSDSRYRALWTHAARGYSSWNGVIRYSMVKPVDFVSNATCGWHLRSQSPSLQKLKTACGGGGQNSEEWFSGQLSIEHPLYSGFLSKYNPLHGCWR